MKLALNTIQLLQLFSIYVCGCDLSSLLSKCLQFKKKISVQFQVVPQCSTCCAIKFKEKSAIMMIGYGTKPKREGHRATDTTEQESKLLYEWTRAFQLQGIIQIINTNQYLIIKHLKADCQYPSTVPQLFWNPFNFPSIRQVFKVQMDLLKRPLIPFASFNF